MSGLRTRLSSTRTLVPKRTRPARLVKKTNSVPNGGDPFQPEPPPSVRAGEKQTAGDGPAQLPELRVGGPGRGNPSRHRRLPARCPPPAPSPLTPPAAHPARARLPRGPPPGQDPGPVLSSAFQNRSLLRGPHLGAPSPTHHPGQSPLGFCALVTTPSSAWPHSPAIDHSTPRLKGIGGRFRKSWGARVCRC